MKNKRYGFTLSEVLVCIVIIGVIMALSVNSIKIVKASYTSLGYFAYHNIKDMIGILNSGQAHGEKLIDNSGKTLPGMTTRCVNNDDVIISVLKSDNEYMPYVTPKCSERQNIVEYEASHRNLFCKSLVAMANTSGKIDCENLYEVEIQDNEPQIVDLNHSSPNFITTNGQRYYISRWTYNENISSMYGFRLIAVDLNGKSRPNRMTVSTNPPPDIITFMVLDNGGVYPLGVVADNMRLADGRNIQYLHSKVKGYYFTYSPTRTTNVAPECTKVVSGQIVSNCNYGIVYLQNDRGNSFFSYREAYCNMVGGSSPYPGYCDGIEKSELCPPTNNEKSFDLCLLTTIKPLFRFNFR